MFHTLGRTLSKKVSPSVGQIVSESVGQKEFKFKNAQKNVIISSYM